MKKMISVPMFVAATVVLGAICLLPNGGVAQVQGSCATCHTMHNSQDGAAVVSGGPYKALTTGGCVGCHTGTNNGSNVIPYVFSASATYDSNTLAGGNFRWVAESGGDAKGHNVAGIASADGTFTSFAAPGNGGSVATGALGAQITCAGATGCHGDRLDAVKSLSDFAAISGAHHAANSSGDLETAGTVGTSYRFLLGIKGKEDSDWEYTKSASDHNNYKGVARTAYDTATAGSISNLCGQCHGNFHAGSGNVATGTSWGNPWVRHPTDIKLPETGEYAGYNPETGYNPMVPVGWVTPGTPARAEAVVTCVSCHRAHGSEQPDLLRWNYADMIAGTTVSGKAGTGCFVCHTTKDGV